MVSCPSWHMLNTSSGSVPETWHYYLSTPYHGKMNRTPCCCAYEPSARPDRTNTHAESNARIWGACSVFTLWRHVQGRDLRVQTLHTSIFTVSASASSSASTWRKSGHCCKYPACITKPRSSAGKQMLQLKKVLDVPKCLLCRPHV